jgi:hypothetical protein
MGKDVLFQIVDYDGGVPGDLLLDLPDGDPVGPANIIVFLSECDSVILRPITHSLTLSHCSLNNLKKEIFFIRKIAALSQFQNFSKSACLPSIRWDHSVRRTF